MGWALSCRTFPSRRFKLLSEETVRGLLDQSFDYGKPWFGQLIDVYKRQLLYRKMRKRATIFPVASLFPGAYNVPTAFMEGVFFYVWFRGI